MAAIVIRRNPERMLELYEPFHPLHLFEDFERVFDSDMLIPDTDWIQGLDVYREKDDLVVKAELPGVSKKDLDISLEDGMLTIKAEKKEEKVTEDTSYYASEREFGQYCRTISLPFEVNSEKISSKFENGVLELRLPKAEEAKTNHVKVEVK